MVNLDLSAKDRLQAAFKVLDMRSIKDLASAGIGPCVAEAVEHERKMVAMGFSFRPR